MPDLDNSNLEINPDFASLGDLTDEQLNFAPLSKGLGFNKKKQAPAPAPKKEAKKVMAKSPAPIAPVAKKLDQIQAVKSAKPRTELNIPTKAVSAQKAPEEKVSIQTPAARPIRRFKAFLFDLILSIGPMTATFMVIFGLEGSKELLLSDTKSVVLFGFSLYFVYFMLSESFGGQSIGKMLFGLRIVEDDKYQKPIGFLTALVRNFFFPLSLLPIGLGPLSAFWDSKLRPWHDKVSASIVREIN